MQSPFQIWITTYEIQSNDPKPVLSHVFYGSTLDEAYGYAKSHLITDFFFSSSFLGFMPWKNSIIKMTNSGDILNLYYPQNPNETQRILLQLNEEAYKINQMQNQAGMLMVIQEVTK